MVPLVFNVVPIGTSRGANTAPPVSVNCLTVLLPVAQVQAAIAGAAISINAVAPSPPSIRNPIFMVCALLRRKRPFNAG
ncbi:hypothetical protein D3C81_1923860 [compost metagenome]